MIWTTQGRIPKILSPTVTAPRVKEENELIKFDHQ